MKAQTELKITVKSFQRHENKIFTSGRMVWSQDRYRGNLCSVSHIFI